jgi:arabinogalactan endo-1,4-beta-galactosidase
MNKESLPSLSLGRRAAALVLVALSGCTAEAPKAPTPFLLGADISAIDSWPALAGKFRDAGMPGTEVGILSSHGWNAFRLRVFVDPVRSAPNNSLANTLPLAKQIKAAGDSFLLDIHYSDTWADPQHQETPVAWRDLDADGLEKRVEQYSFDVITQLKNAGAMPDMVQVGNEITGGMLWPLGHVRVPPSTVKLDAGKIMPLPEPYDDVRQWDNLTRFIKAGVRGVRAAAGSSPVKIVIHIDCGGDWPVTKWYFDHLAAAGVDYDVIGQSFYPFYHGTPDELQQNIVESTRAYHKPFMVVETGYPQSGGDTVMAERKYNLWPGTPEGQLQFLADIVNTVRRAGGAGVYYWAPEGREFGRGDSVWSADGSPAPSVSVMSQLTGLTARPASHLPDPPR